MAATFDTKNIVLRLSCFFGFVSFLRDQEKFNTSSLKKKTKTKARKLSQINRRKTFKTKTFKIKRVFQSVPKNIPSTGKVIKLMKH